MKQTFKLLILGLLLFCSASCGGGSSDGNIDIAIDGTWVGRLEFVDNDTPIGPPVSDVTERTYTLDLSTSDRVDSDLVDFFIVDSFGNSYSGTFSSSRATAHNDAEDDENDGLVETGPSNITFENIDEDRAKVRFVYFFGARGVVDGYEGEFTRSPSGA